jgi:CheY-like chemotaxis protein
MFWFTVPAPVLQTESPSRSEQLTGYRVAVVARNAVLRDGLTALIRGAGGELVPLWPLYASGKPPVALPDAVLVDAGTAGQLDLPIESVPGTQSIVLLTPAARSWLGALSGLGFSGYLVKPIRLKSLIDRVKGTPAAASCDPSPQPKAVATDRQLDHGGIKPVRVLNILLAEDNAVNALLSRELLERRGHTVKVVTSGNEVIEALDRGRFDLLFTDLHMPGLDGIETARNLRAADDGRAHGAMPIVALTADALDATRQACQDAGMDGFLTKPIVPAELDCMVARLFPDNICIAAE